MAYSYPPHHPHHNMQNGWYGGPPQPPQDPFRAWYIDKLATLTFNSRAIIQDLSIEAVKQRDMNNWAGMQAIAEELEAAIYRASPQTKLPLLYLLDSISKNAGSPYTDQLFAPYLPDLYIATYRQVDGVTKNKMVEMLRLWRTGAGGGELYPPGIRERVEHELFGSTGLPPPPQMAPPPLTQANVQAELRQFLQQKEDEMAKEFSTGLAKTVNVLVQIDKLLSTTQVNREELLGIKQQIGAMKGGLQPTSSQLSRQPQPQVVPAARPPMPAFKPRDPYAAQQARPPFPPYAQPPQRYATPPQASHPPQIHAPLPQPALPKAGALPMPANVADILANLSKSGVLSQPLTPEPSSRKSSLEEYEDMILALNMTVDVFDLTKLTLPIAHLPVRCKQCGERFPEGESTLQAHMDWHFRRNRKERETEGRGAHRRWLPRADEWIHENSEAGPSEPKQETVTNTKLTPERLAALKRKWVRAPADPAKAMPCPICKEQFKSEWSEDEEEWVFKNAVSVNGTIYHATCRAEKMSNAVAQRLLGNERGVSRSPAPESVPGSPGRRLSASPLKSPARLPVSPGTKRKAEDEGTEDAKRVKLEPGIEKGGELSSENVEVTVKTET
ncbi:hypothetical protein CC85DRAFT_283755 [Cutaneotrichosporon oleaginosum]|uniref:CID domain-containing protein n=1 Tax=Cutaneotrichosporon oleaginosum TaxID=879819 RepID=A0A0J1B8V9_9TREE|nr:uncharacterized protein CC85DRAFT_283755 [Cutaneotrichosporon oleaginosum]KLT44239.1 hypothetical protein CC85DRAFT_283755 [Cutaneotrichosporon oleaginosum]TXT11593.1 hypothetical protein COLE_02003 [Cutaneotrichosporon oleaginosum]